MTNEEDALAWLVKAIEPPKALNLKKPEAPQKKTEPVEEPASKPDTKPAEKTAPETEPVKTKGPKKSPPKLDVSVQREAVADPKPQG